MPDPYTVLGVSRDADDKTIKTAFRKLAREWHPDRNKAPGAEARFKEINAAHEVLSDPEKRSLYDTYGEIGLQPGFDPAAARGGFRGAPGGASMEDLLGSLFGGARGFRSDPGFGFDPGPADMRARLELDFRTAALGGETALSFSDGRTLKVRIPPGVRDGGTLRLRGKAPGGGDLLLELQVAADPRFERDGDDLHTRLDVTLGTLLLGGSVEVQTLGGPVKMRVPAGSDNGARLRLKGRGIARRNRPPGDLYVTLDVRLPTELDDEARAAVSTLEQRYATREVA